MQDVDIKIEALRIATLIMTQSATAGKGPAIPDPEAVLTEAKKLYEWLEGK